MNKVELIINDPSNAKLDIDDSFKMSIVYSLSDIKDISKRNTSYSKTVTLPGTQNNHYWLGYLYDIKSDFTAFNPNKRTPCKLIVNSELILDGFLQLIKINSLNDDDYSGNEIQYEVVLYDNVIDFYSELGDEEVSDLNFSEFGHTYSVGNIVDSWLHNWQDGYVYPMVGEQLTSPVYPQEYFRPAYYNKKILEKICLDAGFGLTGSLTQNDLFEKEVIYGGNDQPSFSKKILDDRVLEVEGTVGASVSFSTSRITNQTNNFGVYASINNSRIRPEFDNIIQEDVNTLDNTTDIITINTSGTYNFSFSYDSEIVFRSGLDPIMWQTNGATPPTVELRYQIVNDATLNIIYEESSIITLPLDFTSSFQEKSEFFRYSGFSPNLVLTSGETYFLRIQITKTSGWRYVKISDGSPGNLDVFKFINVNNDNNVDTRFKLNSVDVPPAPGEYITTNEYLPNIKKTEFINDLVSRYNLFIYTKPDNTRLLYFDNRDDFYKNGQLLDWTQKLDYDNEQEIELLSEVQEKEIIFSYEQGDDVYNEFYNDLTNITYGQFKYVFDNDFSKGTKEINSIYTSTPLVKTQFSAILPGIDPSEPTSDPRVFYQGDIINYTDYNEIRPRFTMVGVNNNGVGVTQSFLSYPYFGHLNNPVQPTYDLNYGANPYMFYDLANNTQNNLYHLYWKNNINDIANGKLLTAYFNLTETDISQIRNNFNSIIYLNGSEFIINKIDGYDPLTNMPTKVELLTTDKNFTYVNSSSDGFISSGGVQGCPTDIIIIGFPEFVVDPISGVPTLYFYKYISVSGATISSSCCENLGGVWDSNTDSCFLSFNTPVNNNPQESLGQGGNNTTPGNLESQSLTTLQPNNNGDNNTGLIGRSMIIGDSNKVLSGKYQNKYNDPTLNKQLVVGDDNTILGHLAIINGSDNTLLGNNTQISGNNNNINGSNNKIFGNNNTSEKSGTFIVADNLTNDDIEPGNIHLGKEFRIDKSTNDAYYKGELLDNLNNELTVSVDVDADTLSNIYTTPVDLLEAPGADKYYDVISAYINYTYVSAAYGPTGSSVGLFFDGESAPVLGYNDLLTTTESGYYRLYEDQPNTPSPNLAINRNLQLKSIGADPSGSGDGILTVIVNYKIRTI